MPMTNNSQQVVEKPVDKDLIKPEDLSNSPVVYENIPTDLEMDVEDLSKVSEFDSDLD